jgi:YVTN family beta-propeller protein
MRRLGAVALASLLVLACTTAFSRNQQQQLPGRFNTVRDVPLPGDTSRFDYESIDPTLKRLFIAHLGAGTVPVFDMSSGTMLGEIQNVPGVHGVIAVPELGRAYATATSANQVAVIDAQNLAIIATIPGGDYPDGLAYNPEVGKIYVSDESGGTDTVIDVASNQVVATIPLGGEVGNTQYDAAGHQVVVAVQTRNQVVTIDPQTDQVSGSYDTSGCDHPHGLQISPDRRLAFIACQGNNKLVVFDLGSMQVTGSFDVGSSPDVLAFDGPRRVLYVASERGPLYAFTETDTGLTPLAQGDVGPNAHVIAVDQETGHAYLALANVSGHPVLREISVTTGADDD